MTGLARSLVTALVLIAALAGDATGASRYLPHLRFRVLSTPHFRVYYHQGGERLARQVAEIAEAVHAQLPARLGLRAPALTHVVVADQDDAANGSAIPLPYNTITLTAAWPGSGDLIGYTRDWLRLVFTHEYAHILQLDQSRGWAAGLRTVLGRSPIVFPNLALPSWQVEGFATYLESRETGEGRLRAGDATTLVRERVRRAGPEPIDRYNGGRVDWPGGIGPYLYGGLFHEYLAARFGEEKLGELSRRTAGRLPYLSAGAFRPTFGHSLGTLWTDFQRELAAPAADAAAPATRLTRHGFLVSTPRFTADGASVVYSLQTPHEFPSLRVVAAAPRAGPRQVATRYGGEGISLAPGYVFFDQLEIEGNVALRSDLFAARLSGGAVFRLTHGARLLDPAVSPDGRRLVAVRVEGGRRDLAWFSVEADDDGVPRLTATPAPAQAATAGEEKADGARYGSPRWSPDGRWLAVERRLPMGPSEIVLCDVSTGGRKVLASSEVGRNLAPAWTPGSETVLFASDREGAFQIYAVPVAGGEVFRVTAVQGGALSPDVSPDGTRLVYVGYTEAGYDLFETPLPRFSAAAARVVSRDEAVPAAVRGAVAAFDVRDTPYSPLTTLLPRAWAPAGDTRREATRLGVTTGGVDVLGRHAWGATVLWRFGGEGDAIDTRHRGLPDWIVGYTYDRWRAALVASASDETSFLPRYAADGRRLDDAELRERHASAGVSVPWMAVRSLHMAQATFDYDGQTVTTVEGRRELDRHSVRAAWLFTNARSYGYSISREEGVAFSLATEQVRRALGADGNAQAWIAQARAYRGLGGRHAVIALRAGLGISNGDERVRRIFYLGGPSPGSALVDYGSEALAMLRGVDDLAYRGRRVAGGTFEYRVPLIRVERGWRTLPVFLRTVHGAVFADAGHAWDRGFAWADLKSAVGAEISVDLVAGFGLPLTLSGGVAWARDGATGRRLGAAPYVRLGRAF